ncbi:MAG: hypothetical protein JSV83_17670 [Desulfobacterales bacterium]|nr:MAG: hypothetical protein JSV83_17670 [Desulfobacterales bacterium]
MPLYDLTEFLKLSSVLNYNLSAASLNRYNVMMYLNGSKRLDEDAAKDREKKGILMEAIGYLFEAYSQKRRRLGPLAVLHPLRATALLARSLDRLNLVVLLSTLFHDILEDIKPVDFETNKWKEMERQLDSLLERMTTEDEAGLVDNLVCLTRVETETYYHYIGRLLENSRHRPELVQVKLADRLDNTLDMRIELEDPLLGINFFQNIFQLMFVNNYKGYVPDVEHPPSPVLNGARRLFQLFKNAVLLSLIRQNSTGTANETLQILFNAVCDASLKEAQRTLIHLMSYHCNDLSVQRDLVLDAMNYCVSGRSNLVTKPDGEQLLDGLFSTYFAHTSKKILYQKLDLLYQNKPLMIQASIAFIVIFLSFLNDSTHYISGISAEGIAPT